MPQGWDFGALRLPSGLFFKHGHVEYQINGDDEQNRLQVKFSSMSISKIFIPIFVCVLTNERYKTYQTGVLFCRPGYAPGVGLLGTGGT